MVTMHDGLRLLEDMLELPPQALTGRERLQDLEGWDSLATIVFIGAVDKQYNLPLPGGRVAQCRTVDELCALLVDGVKNRAA